MKRMSWWDCVWVETLIVYEIMSVFYIDSSRWCPCLALIVYEIMSVFYIDSSRWCPCLALILYEIMSVFDIDSSRWCPCLALIFYEMVSVFDIDCSRSCPCLALIVKSLFNWLALVFPRPTRGIELSLDWYGFERPLWSRALTSNITDLWFPHQRDVKLFNFPYLTSFTIWSMSKLIWLTRTK